MTLGAHAVRVSSLVSEDIDANVLKAIATLTSSNANADKRRHGVQVANHVHRCEDLQLWRYQGPGRLIVHPHARVHLHLLFLFLFFLLFLFLLFFRLALRLGLILLLFLLFGLLLFRFWL